MIFNSSTKSPVYGSLIPCHTSLLLKYKFTCMSFINYFEPCTTYRTLIDNSEECTKPGTMCAILASLGCQRIDNLYVCVD